EPEPAQVPQDGVARLLRRALGVGVFDAKDERAAVAARQEPVEQRRARVADVKVPGGAWRKSYSHGKSCWLLDHDREKTSGRKSVPVPCRPRRHGAHCSAIVPAAAPPREPRWLRHARQRRRPHWSWP